MRPRHVRFSAFPPLVFLALILAGLLAAAPLQQQPAPPLVRAPAGPQIQEIQPPDPAQGEGVDLSILLINGATGQPLIGAVIELKRNPIINSPQIASDRRRWKYSRNTDGQGAAKIANIVPDRYTITPDLEGYTVAKGTPDSITLAPRAKPAPMMVRMWQSSAVEGTVQDHNENPVPDTVVEILEENWTAGLRTLDRTQSVRTDKDGKFAFPAVLPGTYYLRARPATAVVQQQLKESDKAAEKADGQLAFADTLYPAALFLEQSQPISLVGGQNLLGLRLEMQKSKYYAVRGHVFGIPPEAQPMAGLVLMRRVGFDSPFPFVWKSPYDGAFSLRIDEDGTFTSPSLPPGPYWAGYTPAGVVRGGAQFEIIDRDVEDFKIEVVKGATFSGKVVYEDGSPVEPRVFQLSVFVPNMGIYERGFTVDKDGNFLSPGMPTGTWHIESPNSVVRKIDMDARSFQGNKFDLNAYSGPAVITLSRSGAGIQGSVDLHDRGRSYPRGMVTITPIPQHPTDIPARKYLNGGTSFTVDHLDAGRYRVCGWLEEGAEVNNLLGNPLYEQKMASLCETVLVSQDEHKSIRLKQISAADLR
jgi:hypothetical protein